MDSLTVILAFMTIMLPSFLVTRFIFRSEMCEKRYRKQLEQLEEEKQNVETYVVGSWME